MYGSKKSLERHLKSHQPDSIKCTICHMYFDSEEGLQIHQDKCHSGQPLCPTCGKSFSRKSYLKLHQLRVHDDNYQGRYKCEVKTCGRYFDDKTAFQDHLNLHKGIKPHVCEKCGKSFTTTRSLVNHRRLCLENLRHNCSDCEKQFDSVSALNNHRQAVHLHKIYPCTCGKIFKYLPGLLNHKKIKGH